MGRERGLVVEYRNSDALVSTEWLANHLQAPDVRVVDASFAMPGQTTDGRRHYEEEHIPGAVFFDIDAIADSSSPLPHMLPAPEKFASMVRTLGLGNGNRIVVYDSAGVTGAAARVWWMFRYFGHQDISVLDGGLPKWLSEGRPIEDLPPVPRERHFVAMVNHLLARSFDQVKLNLDSGRELVLDARAAARFAGAVPEPRPAARIGHIPGSVNLPFADLVDPVTHCLLPTEDLAARFAAAGATPGRPVIASCGSGITACVLALGLHLIGHDAVAVYDGSWAEWGNRDDAPVATGA
jgi:thiosulfate/3-mercaptopyruvate sulfurtransferase